MSELAQPYPDAEELANHWWWRPGWGVGTRFYTWHLTLEEQPELRRLVRAYQDVLRDCSAVDLVPERWLHITTQGVGHVQDVTDADRDAIVAAVRVRLARLPPVRLVFHRAVLHREAVVLPPVNPEPLYGIRSAIRTGIADVWEATGVPEGAQGWRPHVSAAYVNAACKATTLRNRLTSVDTAPTEATFAAASLIVLHRDSGMYEWATEARAYTASTVTPSD